jgi:hypothetical protein
MDLQKQLSAMKAKSFKSPKSEMTRYVIVLVVFLAIAFGLYQAKPAFLIRADGQVCPLRVFVLSAAGAGLIHWYMI